MLIGNYIGKQIYSFLQTEYQLSLPPYSFELGREMNRSLTFSINSDYPRSYMGTYLVLPYTIKLTLPKQEHETHLSLMYQLISAFCSESFKTFLYENRRQGWLPTTVIFVNDYPNPNEDIIHPTLDSYTESTQTYSINLTIYLGEPIWRKPTLN